VRKAQANRYVWTPRASTLRHSKKPKLLLLTSSFPGSPGDETCGYIRDFARSLATYFDITILAPPHRSKSVWPLDVFMLKRSASLWPKAIDPFNAGEDLNGLASASMLTKLVALVSLVCFFAHSLVLALRTDAICSHWMLPSGVVGAVISRLLGKPHVVVEHSGGVHLLIRMRGGWRITRFIIRGSSRVITVSVDLKEKLVALNPDAANKVSVIPMGTAVPAQPAATPANRSPRTILFIGRLTEIKGLEVLLDAMSGLENVRLIVAGDGERREPLEELARAGNVSAQFVGRINADERSRLLSECEALVIPSHQLSDGRTEGAPVVCLEAMAAGRVVIASRVGGLAEAIVDGENGLLFEPGNHLKLKDKLLLVLSDDSLRSRLSENARRTAAAYDWTLIGSRYGTIINRALRTHDATGNRRIEVSNIN